MNPLWTGAGRIAGTVLADVAPILGGALFGPVGSSLGTTAARVITTVLGLQPSAPPAQIVQAVAQATPDQITALKAAEQQFAAHTLEIAAQVDAGQVSINRGETEQAGTKWGWFVAGWRPAVGWILAAGLARELVFAPILAGIIRFRYPEYDFFHTDLQTLVWLLAGMLGIGTMRTIEKIQGVAGGEVQSTPNERANFEVRDKVAPPTVLPVPVPATVPAPVPGISIVDYPATPTAPAPVVTPVVTPRPPPASPDRKPFFDIVRADVFGGRLVQSQVDGCQKILDFWDTFADKCDKRQLAYALATVAWETGRTMQPVEEVGRGAGHAYGATGFYGRGLVQISLEDNYRKMSAVVGVDLVAHPEKALEWPNALVILFVGMIKGMFTGHKLSDYFNANTDDPVGARAIVNGQDRAHEIAAYHRSFLSALDAEP